MYACLQPSVVFVVWVGVCVCCLAMTLCQGLLSRKLAYETASMHDVWSDPTVWACSAASIKPHVCVCKKAIT